MSLWRKRQKTKERNVLEQALDALYLTVQYCEFPQGGGVLRDVRKAINDIKEELAQPETPYKIGQRIAKTGGGISHLWSAVSQEGEIAEAERGFKEALAQPTRSQKMRDTGHTRRKKTWDKDE